MYQTISQIVNKIRQNCLGVQDMLSTGGSWLGAARNWIQWNARNGDDVTWGSDEYLQINPLTVKDIEYFAAKIAKATLEEYAANLVTEGERIALKTYMNKENWGSEIKEENRGNLVAFNPNRDKMHFATAYRHKHGWDIAETIEPLSARE